MVPYDCFVHTAPVPGKHCTINNNGNYHCDCIQEVHVENNCQQLLTVNVSGYPVPSISWFVSNSAATNDNQVLLTILGNGSVSDVTYINSELMYFLGKLYFAKDETLWLFFTDHLVLFPQTTACFLG